jgi:hypothetical protein
MDALLQLLHIESFDIFHHPPKSLTHGPMSIVITHNVQGFPIIDAGVEGLVGIEVVEESGELGTGFLVES